jgi:UDP-GlcNAc:undecaprenyl-phosphate/decaprenyl-phosphate GlcNAc-1-phosphate transferase
MSNLIIIYSILSFLLLFSFSKISYKLNLVDLPNKRKIHSKATAYTGGIAVSFALIFSILIFNISSNTLNLIFSIGFLISIVGLVDDKYNLNVGGKLSLQIIPILYLIIFENLFLTNLGEYNYFKLTLGAFSIPFTLISVLFLINSFNYFDGINGTLCSVLISVLSILYFLNDNQNVQLFLLIILIPTIIFLFFNFSIFKLPRLFLGDGGSLLLGFIISFTLIYLENQNSVHPVLLAWSVAIFVYEFLSINLIRIKNNHGLFKAGHDHLHHIIYKKTNSIFLTNFLLFILNIILFIFGYLSFLLINPLASLMLFIVLFLIFLILRNQK